MISTNMFSWEKIELSEQDIYSCWHAKTQKIKIKDIRNSFFVDLIKKVFEENFIEFNRDLTVFFENRKIKATHIPNRDMSIHRDSFGISNMKCFTIMLYYRVDSEIENKDLEIYPNYEPRCMDIILPKRKIKNKEIIPIETGTLVYLSEGIMHKPQDFYSKKNDKFRCTLNIYVEID